MDAVVHDITQAVGARLAAVGVAGTVVVLPESIELRAAGMPAAIDTPGLVAAWSGMPPDRRVEVATELAQRLADASRMVRVAASRRARAGVSWIAITVGGVVMLAAAAVFVAILRSTPEDVVASASASAAAVEASRADQERSARRARACEAARKKAYAGAPLSSHEGEGWVVELWLARTTDKRLSDTPGLRAFVSAGRITAAADAELAKIEGAEATLEEATPTKVALGKGWGAARMTFSGAYVDSFLDPSGRARFLALADRAAHVADAAMGALYARCETLESHELGAWFYGVDARAASTALLYSMGVFAQTPAVPKSITDSADGALGALMRGAEGIDTSKLANSLGTVGGAVSTADSAVTLTFPLGGPIRATAASRELARITHLDGHSPAP